MSRSQNNQPAFTIVELLVVIVVIGILAAITIVSYTGISQKATVVSLSSDLSNASKQLKLYQIEHGSYPTSLDGNNCPLGSDPSPDMKYCLKATSGNVITYTNASYSSYQKFIMVATNTNSATRYRITNDLSSVSAILTETVTIGTQVWMKNNLDVGTMLTGGTAQTNNAAVEKWCYNNDSANCTIYGGLYQWDEMMQYVTTEGTQGICPSGFHIPTDTEWKTMELYLGMTQIQADATGWRGTDQSAGLKQGGATGFEGLFGGAYYNATWNLINSYGFWATSSEYTTDTTRAWQREIANGNSQIVRTTSGNYSLKTAGLPVRCIKN